jgi:threonine dehydrogenase-like Zn-dependent dehydrogenase
MILREFARPLSREALDIPELHSGQVLVRVTAAGICGSDVHMWTGKDPRTPLPMILGHEGVGVVAEVAGEKRGMDGIPLRTGDRILWNRGVVCGDCYWCTTASQPELCPNRWVYGIHRSVDQPTYLNGCYGEYLVLDERTDVFRLPDGVDDDAVLVPASCSGATVAHAFDICPPRPGETVLVQGPGPLGIFAIAFARAFGAGRVIVVGGTEERLTICGEMGSDVVLNRRRLTTEERRQVILSQTDGRGVDWAIEAVGTPEALREGIDLVRRGGTYVSVGVGAPVGTIELDLYRDIEVKNLRLQGIWVSHTQHTGMALDLILTHFESFRRMVTHRFTLDEATLALEAVERRDVVKAVLVP